MTLTPDDQVYGASISGAEVEEAMSAHLQQWMQTYIARLERKYSRPAHSVALPASYRIASAFKPFSADATPLVLIVSPGLAGKPRRGPRGRYQGSWHVGVAVMVNAGDAEETNRLTKLYAEAVRLAVTQHGALGGFAIESYWEDEAYADFAPETARSRGVAQNVFTVTVDNIATSTLGPLTPPDDPYADPTEWPVPTSFEVDLTRETIE